MTNFTKSKTLRITEDIRNYRKHPFNYTDKQIQCELSLTERMWYRYNRIVNEQDKEIWLSITRTQLETELLNLKQSLEDTYRIAKEQVQKAETTQERLLASETKDNARLNIVRLLVDGPAYVRKIDDYVDGKDKSKQKIIMIDRK